jgi:hypothetical protein
MATKSSRSPRRMAAKPRANAARRAPASSQPEPRSVLTKLYTPARRQRLGLPAPRAGRPLPPGMIRLDYPSARGYLIRLGYTRTKTGYKPQRKAYFSDTRWGSRAKARAAAEAWLKRFLRTGRVPKRLATGPAVRRARAAA